MRSLAWFLGGALTLVILASAGVIVYARTMAQGLSARTRPPAIEAFAADLARKISMPADAKEKQNPVPDSAEVIAEGRAHWADHCASCHANDGSGRNTMGVQMYPQAPDMRREGTQKLTDGELFYIIENGVRLTGMPAWGGARTQQDSWKLVRFVRHLPSLTPDEIREMESLNPKSPEDIEEEKQEEEFLKGGAPAQPETGHHHHH